MTTPTAIVGASVEVLEAQIARLLNRMKLAVVFGGQKRDPAAVINPTINPRSWKSYESVAQDIAGSLRRIGFRHVELMPDDMRLGDRLRNAGIHLAWLNTGGVHLQTRTRRRRHPDGAIHDLASRAWPILAQAE